MKSKKLEAPITINEIEVDEHSAMIQDGISIKAGTLVSIRPCNPQYQDKTYLGLYLGDIALGMKIQHDQENGKLHLGYSFHNPAIFVFDLKEIIFGVESWWGKIESEEQLRQITDNDIENVWYVKALKQLHNAQGE